MLLRSAEHVWRSSISPSTTSPVRPPPARGAAPRAGWPGPGRRCFMVGARPFHAGPPTRAAHPRGAERSVCSPPGGAGPQERGRLRAGPLLRAARRGSCCCMRARPTAVHIVAAVAAVAAVPAVPAVAVTAAGTPAAHDPRLRHRCPSPRPLPARRGSCCCMRARPTAVHIAVAVAAVSDAPPTPLLPLPTHESRLWHRYPPPRPAEAGRRERRAVRRTPS